MYQVTVREFILQKGSLYFNLIKLPTIVRWSWKSIVKSQILFPVFIDLNFTTLIGQDFTDFDYFL